MDPGLLQQQASQADRTRTARRATHWPMFRQLTSTARQELALQGDLPADELQALQEYILAERRHAKAQLETQEKGGDFYEKAALPMAAVPGFLGGWLSSSSLIDADWKSFVTWATAAIAAGLWFAIRTAGYRKIIDARQRLARLGKVD